MFDNLRKTLATAALATLAIAVPAKADGIMEEPLPRFEDRICPGVLGLEREYAELMVSRIRDNAEQIGLRLSGSEEEGCEPNLVVAFVDDGQAYLADLMERRFYLFRDMDPADREEMLAGEQPWRAWHQVAAHTRDGIRVGRRENLSQLPEAGMWQAHSRIYRPVRHDITYALVLFDREEVRGLSLRQLADFATLQAFSTEFPEEAETRESSVLRLFDGGEDLPEGLSDYDTAWLTALYDGIPNVPASFRLRNVEVASTE
ncbi:hypothetical protein OZN62_07785 [Aurantiacibacter sp. MUD11]|uniref:hypothetical protein n=1 Tax=Aurantiacibacter sp. MUD11 TaxID=3003265 RepID=UPI0022AB0F18|nr:hypothetical protein [Aurantiacibacter sp. MUD11]WAT16845.1 hypothetical protein OZN62_07785 [Aurantiacibacter sp. MUD11]